MARIEALPRLIQMSLEKAVQDCQPNDRVFWLQGESLPPGQPDQWIAIFLVGGLETSTNNGAQIHQCVVQISCNAKKGWSRTPAPGTTTYDRFAAEKMAAPIRGVLAQGTLPVYDFDADPNDPPFPPQMSLAMIEDMPEKYIDWDQQDNLLHSKGTGQAGFEVQHLTYGLEIAVDVTV